MDRFDFSNHNENCDCLHCTSIVGGKFLEKPFEIETDWIVMDDIRCRCVLVEIRSDKEIEIPKDSEDWLMENCVNMAKSLSKAINVAENFDVFIKLITGSTATQLLQNEYEHTIKNLIKFRKHQIGKVYIGDN